MVNWLIELSLRNRFLVIALFVLLGAWGYWALVTTPIDAIPDLSDNQVIAPSVVGIVVAAVSLVIMALLVSLKRKVATQMKSGALEAESRQTAVMCFLVRNSARRPGAECLARLVVGRPGSRSSDGALDCQGGD